MGVGLRSFIAVVSNLRPLFVINIGFDWDISFDIQNHLTSNSAMSGTSALSSSGSLGLHFPKQKQQQQQKPQQQK